MRDVQREARPKDRAEVLWRSGPALPGKGNVRREKIRKEKVGRLAGAGTRPVRMLCVRIAAADLTLGVSVAIHNVMGYEVAW